MWRVGDQPDKVIEAADLYYIAEHTPITGTASLVTAHSTPMKPTNLRQSDSSTYAETSISLEWNAPQDTGCLPIGSYNIEAFIDAQWQNVGTS